MRRKMSDGRLGRVKSFSLLEVSISLAIFLIIIGEVFWTFRWSSIQMKLSEQNVLAYNLGVRQIERMSMYNVTNVASTRASTDPSDPLYNYFVQTNISVPLWDSSHQAGPTVFPEDGFINPLPNGEYNADYSAGSTFVKVTVNWTDYLGKAHQMCLGTVKARDRLPGILLHLNGVDGSTIFPDSSVSGHTVTRSGYARISTARSRFGGASAYFDGAQACLNAADSTDFTFGTGDFTVEAWVYPSAIAGNYEGIIGTYNGDGFILTTSCGTDGHIGWWNSTNGWIDTNTSLDLNTWNHIAVTRQSNTLRIFKNGIRIYEVGGWNGSIDGGPLTIGYWHPTYAYFNGYIDEIRIAKGVAFWTANFSVPPFEYK